METLTEYKTKVHANMLRKHGNVIDFADAVYVELARSTTADIAADILIRLGGKE
jgi:hypothetical protein